MYTKKNTILLLFCFKILISSGSIFHFFTDKRKINSRTLKIDSIIVYFYNYDQFDTTINSICNYDSIKSKATLDSNIFTIKRRAKLDSILQLLEHNKFIFSIIYDSTKCKSYLRRYCEITDFYDIFTNQGRLRIGLYRPSGVFNPFGLIYHFFVECYRVKRDKKNELLLTILNESKDNYKVNGYNN